MAGSNDNTPSPSRRSTRIARGQHDGNDNTPSPARRSTRSTRGQRDMSLVYGYGSTPQTSQTAPAAQSSQTPQVAQPPQPSQATQPAQMVTRSRSRGQPHNSSSPDPTSQPAQPQRRGDRPRSRGSLNSHIPVVQPARRRPSNGPNWYTNRLVDNTDVCRVCDTKQASSRDNMEYARWLQWRMCHSCYTDYGTKETFQRVTKPDARWRAKVEARHEEVAKAAAEKKANKREEKRKGEAEEDESDEDGEGKDNDQTAGRSLNPPSFAGRSLIPPSFTIRTGPSTSDVPPRTVTPRAVLSTSDAPLLPRNPASLPAATYRDLYTNDPGPIPPHNYSPPNLTARLPSPEPIGGFMPPPLRRQGATLRPLNEGPDAAMREALRSQNVIEDANLSWEQFAIRRRLTPRAEDALEPLRREERRRRFSEGHLDDLMMVDAPGTVDAPIVVDDSMDVDLAPAERESGEFDPMEVDDHVQYREPSEDIDVNKMFD